MYKLTELSIALLLLAGSGFACKREGGTKLTAYGWPDAHLPTNYRCDGSRKVPNTQQKNTILGDGSFDKPYAAAAALGSHTYKECDKIYVPILKKYFKIQDDCYACHQNPDKHVDLYVAQFNKNVGQLQCEKEWGTFTYNGQSIFSHEVITSAPKGFKVNTQPLFKDHKCYNKVSDHRVFPERDGKVKCGGPGHEADDADADSTESLASIKDFNDTPTPDIPGDLNITATEDPVVAKVESELPNENPDGSADAKTMRFARAVQGSEE